MVGEERKGATRKEKSSKIGDGWIDIKMSFRGTRIMIEVL